MATRLREWRFPIAWLFYLLIGFEIIYMISPFALYYYSTYGLGLSFLNSFSATSWLTGFFLPHYTETSSAVLRWLPALGGTLAIAGLVFFSICAVQIYYAKFTKRGAVTGGVYRWIRHPQYTAFATMGLGVLIVWPRFAVLVLYVAMLFVYYLLARREEDECVEKFGIEFTSYMAKTSMFLPGKFTIVRFLPAFPRERKKRLLLGNLLFVGVMTLAIGLGIGLRNYSIDSIATFYSEDAATISTMLMSETEIATTISIATRDPNVRARLSQAGFGSGAKLLNYVVPVNWFLVDLPLEAVPDGDTGYGHHTPMTSDPHRFKILFTKAHLHDTNAAGPDIIRQTFGRSPILVVEVDAAAGQVTAILDPIAHVPWGDIPTPLF